MHDPEPPRPEPQLAISPDKEYRLGINSSTLGKATIGLIAMAGAASAIVVLFRTDNDPIATLLDAWPVVLAAGALYLLGMCIYAVSWALLFAKADRRRLIGLGFLISQPVKYLPGGFAQPISQVALGVQAAGSTSRVVVAFPVHVLINVVAAITLSAPFLLIADLPSWARWAVVLVPIVWVSLDRRWMAALLLRLGRIHRVFRVSDELPPQRNINTAFAAGLLAHGTMFASFGVLSAGSVPGWSAAQLSVAYGIAWVIGYIAIPAPAGLGAREAVLAVLLNGALPAVNVIKISAVHRILTLVIELVLLLVAVVMTRAALRGSKDRPATAHSPKSPHSEN
jgi:hypothetical protein